MSEPMFTKGPWILDPKLPFRVYSTDATGSIIAGFDFQFAPRPDAEKTANARLTSAAPDYDAATVAFLAPYAELGDDFLREIAERDPGDCLIVGGRFSLTAHVAASVLALRAAFAKGRGER
jgi:hypothetical protein